MRKVFDETKINRMVLQNRLVRSATWEGMCGPDGRPTERLAALYGNLARGGVGLIVTGYAFVRPDGRQLPGQMGIDGDAFAAEMETLPRAVHPHGARICLQLVHAGGQTSTKSIGCRPKAPSAVAVDQFPETPEALTVAEIEDLVDRFGAAAGRARAYGFDCVEIHAAHGYLVNQFLSPLTNRRDDIYGGCLENRCRFLLDVYRSVRGTVGPEFPVLVKLNGDDFLPGGLAADDALYAARALDAEGVDAIEVSGGTPASGDRTPVRQGIDSRQQEAYNLPLAAHIRNGVRCPVIVVGGLRSLDLIEGIIRREEADYVSLARPFIREPHLTLRWQEGNDARARCISCNGCFKPGLKEKGIYCVVDKIERESRGQAL
jgi:2,4-dienoyl-CoA reductase-like NADH-dependent reductase (Old Yellow Enzyme family)